jgi:5-methylcytosine-specific restriction protein A
MAGVCSTPGCPDYATRDGRCDSHRRQTEQHRRHTVPTKAARTAAIRRRRARVVAAWRAEHGDHCPGYGRPPHASSDLTADDPMPIAEGGDPWQELAVLCRACNGRKGARLGPGDDLQVINRTDRAGS